MSLLDHRVEEEVASDPFAHEASPLQPGDSPQGVEVGLEGKIAVAQVPGRGFVAGYRFHFHIHREQVVAAMSLLDHRVEEEVAGDPFAHEAALHVHHGDHHRVDVAGFHQLFEAV